MNSTTLTIAPFGLARTAMAGSALTVGWGKASMNPPANLTGTETIQLIGPAATAINEAAVLQAQPDTVLRLPVFEKDGIGTGLALANLAGTAVEAALTLRNSAGEAVSAIPMTIDAQQQIALFVFELFPGTRTSKVRWKSPPRARSPALRCGSISARVYSVQSLVSANPVESYFSPHAAASTRIVREIERALDTVDVAIYSFTRDAIADALIAAKNRGVQVRMVNKSEHPSARGKSARFAFWAQDR